MALRFGLRKGDFLGTLKSEILPKGGMAMAGGALGGVVFGMVQNQKFFTELMVKDVAVGSDKYNNIMLGKQIVLASLLGLGGGSALWMAGEYGQDAARGLMGAMGATITAVVWNKVAKEEASRIRLQGFRGSKVYQGGVEQLPAGLASGRLSGPSVQSRSAYENRSALMSVLG